MSNRTLREVLAPYVGWNEAALDEVLAALRAEIADLPYHVEHYRLTGREDFYYSREVVDLANIEKLLHTTPLPRPPHSPNRGQPIS